MRREDNSQKLGDIVKAIMHSNTPIGRGLLKHNIQETARRALGENLQKHIKDIQYKTGTLFISLDSSIVKEEVSYVRGKIIQEINHTIHKEVVKEIRLK